MTETSYEDEVLEATYELLPNEVLGGLLAECLARVGPPAFTDADRGFAQRIAAGFEPGQKATSLEALFEGTAVPPELMAQTLNETIVSAEGIRPTPRGSTDVADVSWCCPTAQFSMACYAIGTSGHSWQIAAQSGTGVGHAGMIAAAKVLAEAGMELLTRPKLLELAKAEFLRRTGGKAFRSALPEGLKPPFHQLAGMAATRGPRGGGGDACGAPRP
jgi:aminobenzoyl-glutamate utilization protein B